MSCFQSSHLVERTYAVLHGVQLLAHVDEPLGHEVEPDEDERGREEEERHVRQQVHLEGHHRQLRRRHHRPHEPRVAAPGVVIGY